MKRRILFTVCAVLYAGAFVYIGFFANALRYEITVGVAEKNKVEIPLPVTAGLDFGRLAKGTSARQRLRITNRAGRDRFFKFLVFGETADLITVKPAAFSLGPGRSRVIEVTAELPVSTPEKQYTGQLRLVQMPKVW